jgi:hypothetical protein
MLWCLAITFHQQALTQKIEECTGRHVGLPIQYTGSQTSSVCKEPFLAPFVPCAPEQARQKGATARSAGSCYGLASIADATNLDGTSEYTFCGFRRRLYNSPMQITDYRLQNCSSSKWPLKGGHFIIPQCNSSCRRQMTHTQ